MSKRQQVEEQAFNYHNGGYHCAEAISRAIMEAYCDEQLSGIPRAATAFGGGVGKTHQDMCGALSGALLGLGLVFGRTEPGPPDWAEMAQMSSELRQTFINEVGSTNCAVILKSLGEQTNMLKCKKLSGKTAGMAAEIIERELRA
jgi:C_GCAxxG_C_C family probable redox protein